MGGFVSYDGNKTLSLDDIERLVATDAIEYPIASEDEIKDRSKGDGVTKALVVFQTTWFLLQCAARGSRGLAITELELATAAFAVLNIITYAIWWNKPLDVQCPIRVRRTRAQEERDGFPASGTTASPGRGTSSTAKEGWSFRDEMKAVIKPFRSMIDVSVEDDDTFFLAGIDAIGPAANYGAIFITLVFGGIHCIGWSFHFPSHTEQLLWRISSIAITGVPLAFQCLDVIETETSITIPWGIFVLILLLYVFSRVVLLVLSLTTLRSLPPSALQTVEWTTFLPHV